MSDENWLFFLLIDWMYSAAFSRVREGEETGEVLQRVPATLILQYCTFFRICALLAWGIGHTRKGKMVAVRDEQHDRQQT